jgi:hypothetical protein
MAIFQNNLLAGAGAQSSDSTYAIDQSIRFNKADSAFMYRNFSGAGNKKTATWSFWCKRADLADRQDVISFAQDVPFIFQSDDTLKIATFGVISLVTNRVFRDPSAWYHFVLTVDSTNQISTDRIRLYVNGQRETSFSTESYPSLNADANFYTGTPSSPYTAYAQQIGNIIGGSYYNSLYLAEIHYLDGISYGPEYFGETNSNGIWIPKQYDGSYGTNGFYIDGRDSSDLGDDESGNGNDFTTSGLAAHDQMLDTPTNNFAVLNPADTFGKLAGEIRNGNLELKDNSASVYVHGRATFGFDVTDSNGFYWESCDVVDGSQIGGICEDNAVIPSGSDVGFTGARGSNSVNTSNYYKLENTTYNSVDLGVASNAGDIVQFCVKNGKLFIGINNTYVLSGNPATEANPLFTGLTGIFMPFGGLYSGFSYNTIYNFGQDGTFAGNKTAQGNTDANGYGNFFYAPPSGAKALCSKSLGS